MVCAEKETEIDIEISTGSGSDSNRARDDSQGVQIGGTPIATNTNSRNKCKCMLATAATGTSTTLLQPPKAPYFGLNWESRKKEVQLSSPLPLPIPLSLTPSPSPHTVQTTSTHIGTKLAPAPVPIPIPEVDALSLDVRIEEHQHHHHHYQQQQKHQYGMGIRKGFPVTTLHWDPVIQQPVVTFSSDRINIWIGLGGNLEWQASGCGCKCWYKYKYGYRCGCVCGCGYGYKCGEIRGSDSGDKPRLQLLLGLKCVPDSVSVPKPISAIGSDNVTGNSPGSATGSEKDKDIDIEPLRDLKVVRQFCRVLQARVEVLAVAIAKHVQRNGIGISTGAGLDGQEEYTKGVPSSEWDSDRNSMFGCNIAADPAAGAGVEEEIVSYTQSGMSKGLGIGMEIEMEMGGNDGFAGNDNDSDSDRDRDNESYEFLVCEWFILVEAALDVCVAHGYGVNTSARSSSSTSSSSSSSSSSSKIAENVQDCDMIRAWESADNHAYVYTTSSTNPTSDPKPASSDAKQCHRNRNRNSSSSLDKKTMTTLQKCLAALRDMAMQLDWFIALGQAITRCESEKTISAGTDTASGTSGEGGGEGEADCSGDLERGKDNESATIALPLLDWADFMQLQEVGALYNVYL